MTYHHVPVLLDECLNLLHPEPGETALDATTGGGGHSFALAKALQPNGTLIGLDRDMEAIQASKTRLESMQTHLHIILVHAAFGKLNEVLDADIRTKNSQFDVILFDLGVSSHQLDSPRGFSFRRDEPLDMRLDTTSELTAAGLLRTVTESELTRILQKYGEERWAKRIAENLIAQRERREWVETTGQLAALVERSVPRAAWPRDIHVATRTFQALRIAVNDELNQLQSGLDAAIVRLKTGGRIAVISFHSLEDRIVKQTFARWAGRAPSPSRSSLAALQTPKGLPLLKLLTRKPVEASAAEIGTNPRSRSAKLRAAERTPI